ncbi:hypothetical protein [Alkaliphilus crotonatoxidans]
MRKTMPYVVLILITSLFLFGCGVEKTITGEILNGTEDHFHRGIGSFLIITPSEDDPVILEEEAFSQGSVTVIIAAATFDQEGRIVEATFNANQKIIYTDGQGRISTDRVLEALRQQEINKIDQMIDSGLVNPCGVNWYTAGTNAAVESLTLDNDSLQQMNKIEEWFQGKSLEEIKNENGDFPEVQLTVGSVALTKDNYIKAMEEAYLSSLINQ